MADTQPKTPTAFLEIVGDDLPTQQPICQAGLNGEYGNDRDASVHADGAKSRLLKRAACTLRRRNSLRMAIQLWDKARSCYGFPDCTAHPTQEEADDGTGS